MSSHNSKLIRISSTGIKLVRTGATKTFFPLRSLSVADAVIFDNTTLSTPTAAAQKTHIIEVQLSNVLPNDSSFDFEVQFEKSVFVNVSESEADSDSSDDYCDESATEVICV